MSFSAVYAQQQDSLRNALSTEKIVLLKTLWSESDNPAGLQSYNIPYRLGTASLLYHHEKGDYHRFQDEKEQNIYGFQTNGYLRLNDWKFYGAFNYVTREDKGVKWVDVLDPYDDNPYTLGDATGGTYHKEFFDMQARGALAISKSVNLGFGIAYNTGVGARRKDPRPTNKTTDFDFKPGIVFKTGKFNGGLNLQLQTEKEDISLKTLSDSTYSFYHFRGLGAFSSTLEMDDRSTQSALWGGGVQLGWKGNQLSNLTQLSFFQKETDIKRGNRSPIQVVLLEKFETNASSTFSLRNSLLSLHRLKIHFTNKHIYGHEPVLEPNATQENYQWSAVAKYVLYWHKENNFGFDYSFNQIKDRNHFNWTFNAGALIRTSETSYYFVPEKNIQKINYFTLNAALGKEINTRVADLVFLLKGAYQKGFNSNLNLVTNTTLQETINTEMVTHDFDFWAERLTELGSEIRLARKIKMYKQPMLLYLGIDYNKCFSKMTSGSERNIVSIQLGINF